MTHCESAKLETPNFLVSSESGVRRSSVRGLRLIPWLLLGSACTWIPHLESDPSVRESPGEECSSSEAEKRGSDSIRKCDAESLVSGQRQQQHTVFAGRMKIAQQHRLHRRS